MGSTINGHLQQSENLLRQARFACILIIRRQHGALCSRQASSIFRRRAEGYSQRSEKGATIFARRRAHGLVPPRHRSNHAPRRTRAACDREAAKKPPGWGSLLNNELPLLSTLPRTRLVVRCYGIQGRPVQMRRIENMKLETIQSEFVLKAHATRF
jgi:hypothetical protein